MLVLALKQVQVVCGGYRNDVFLRVPRCVEDFLVEVQAVYTNFVLFPLAPSAHFARLEDSFRLHVFPRSFERDVSFTFPVEHTEEVVV